MAADPGSNNLDDFDIEQVINWDEHNYASKNLQFQQLPDLDLPTDVPVTAQLALSATSTPVSHGGGMMMRSTVLGSHPQTVVSQDQGTNIIRMPQPTHTSVLNPVFPQDASCIITDIRQELGNSRSAAQTRSIVSPTFPSENFELPSLSHPHHMRHPSAPTNMNYMPRHASQVAGSPQMVHTMPQHQSLHTRMAGFNQSPMQAMPVNQQLTAGLGDDADDGSIDKLIEDIVDRDLPQGVDDPLVFTHDSHPMSLGTQHVPHQMSQVIQRSSSPGQMVSMVHSPVSSQSMPLGSPMAGNQPRGGGTSLGNVNPLAGSPLGQRSGSPLVANLPGSPKPSAAQPQHKPSQAIQTATKPTMKLQTQQQPASPSQAIQTATKPTMKLQQLPSPHPPIGMSHGQGQVSRSVTQSPGMSSGMAQSPRPAPSQTSPLAMSPGQVQVSRPGPQNTGMGMSPGPVQSPRPAQLQASPMGMPSGQVQSPQPMLQNAGMVTGPGQSSRPDQQNTGMGMTPAQSPRPLSQSTSMGMMSGSVQSPRPSQQNTGMSMTPGPVQSPRSAPQRSPQQAMNILSPSAPQSSAAITSSAPSPMSQMSVIKMMGTSQASAQYMSVPQSSVQSPVKAPSPQNTRPPLQAPAPRSGNQVVSKGKDVAKLQAQAGFTPTSQASFTSQSTFTSGKPQVTQPVMVSASHSVHLQTQVRPQVSGGKPMEKLKSTMQIKSTYSKASKSTQPKAAQKITAGQKRSSAQAHSSTSLYTQTASSTSVQASATTQTIPNVQTPASTAKVTTTSMSALDSTTAQNILKGISALKGKNIIPLTLKQGGTQGMQTVQLQGNNPSANLIRQAMMLRAAAPTSTGQTIVTGQPMSVSTSQGQVIYYVLPRGTNVNTATQLQGFANRAVSSNPSGQPLRMIVINAKTPVNVSKPVATPVDAAHGVPLTQTLSVGGVGVGAPLTVSHSLPGHSPVAAMSSVVKSVGNNNVLMSTLPMSTLSNGSIMSTGQNNQNVLNTGIPQPAPSFPPNTGPTSMSSQVPGIISTPVSAPSNPATVGHIQSSGTTQITFVNESTAIGQLVASSGGSNNFSGSITNQLQKFTNSIDPSMSMAMPKVQQEQTVVPVPGDSDSDTPLADVAENLKKNGGEEKKKKKKKKGEKRKKKEKMAGEPPKPLSAYQLFFKETQAAIRQQNPTAQFGEIAKIVGQMWENLPEEQKKVYYAKHEKAKADYQKALKEFKKDAPMPKVPKLEGASQTGTVPKFTIPKFYGGASARDPPKEIPKHEAKDSSKEIPKHEAKDPSKESPKQEAITLKIPKSAVIPGSKSNGAANKLIKPAPTSAGMMKITSNSVASNTQSPKPKKPKLAINPITQRMCVRDGCNMPARTTKERGTQYCSNECIVLHCRMVFDSWVMQRKAELISVKEENIL